MILLNVFWAIQMDSLAEVQEDEFLESEDAAVVDMMTNASNAVLWEQTK